MTKRQRYGDDDDDGEEEEVWVWVCTEKRLAMWSSEMPMPVSRTVSSITPESPRLVRLTEMAPFSGVNLMAFERRLYTTCLNLWAEGREMKEK
jgi:hypothetical protein